MDNTLVTLAYEAELRGVDKQEQLLSELRSRTGLLLAASSLAALRAENDEEIRKVTQGFALAVAALAGEIVLLLASVSGTLL